MTIHLLSHSLASSPLNYKLNDRRFNHHHHHYHRRLLLPLHRRHQHLLSPRFPCFTLSNTLKATPLPQNASSSQSKPSPSPPPSSVLLHVPEIATVKLRSKAALSSSDLIGITESLMKRLTDVGFPFQGGCWKLECRRM